MSGKGPHKNKKHHKVQPGRPIQSLMRMGNLLDAIEEVAKPIETAKPEPTPAKSAYNFSNMFGALEGVKQAMKEKEEKKLEAALKKAEKEKKALEKAGLETAAKASVLTISSKGRRFEKPPSYKETVTKRTRTTHKKNKRSSK
jgi:hypothetical protein